MIIQLLARYLSRHAFLPACWPLAALLGLTLTLAPMAPLQAQQTQYVSDTLEITLRQGKSTRYRILRSLPSGTPLEIITPGDSSGYTQVRTEDDVTGYVLTRFLMDEPSARTRLEDALQRAETASARSLALETRNTELQEQVEEKEARIQLLTRERNELDEQLSALRSATTNTQRTLRENVQLRSEVTAYKTENQELYSENLRYRDAMWREFFIYGAGTILLGIVLGLVLPNLKRRRRRWGEA